MCGLCGFLDPNLAGSDRETDRILRAMNAAIAHRGPDSDGIWIDRDAGIGLSHKRLSIVDL